MVPSVSASSVAAPAQRRARRGSARRPAPGGSGRTAVALTKPTSHPSSVRARCGSHTPTERSPSTGSGRGAVSSRWAPVSRSARRPRQRHRRRPGPAPVEVAPGAGRDQPASVVGSRSTCDGVVAERARAVGPPEEEVGEVGELERRAASSSHSEVCAVSKKPGPALVAESTTRPSGRAGDEPDVAQPELAEAARPSARRSPSAAQPGLVAGVDPARAGRRGPARSRRRPCG